MRGMPGTRGMFKKIPGVFKKIPGNLNLDLFCEILLNFDQILRLNCVKTKKYFLRYYLLLIANLLGLNTVFLPPLSFLFFFSCRGKGSVSGNAQVQGYQKTLNNPQLRGLKNMLHRVGTINLKLENWINAFFAYRPYPKSVSKVWNCLLYSQVLIHMWCFDLLLHTFLIILECTSFDSIFV